MGIIMVPYLKEGKRSEPSVSLMGILKIKSRQHVTKAYDDQILTTYKISTIIFISYSE